MQQAHHYNSLAPSNAAAVQNSFAHSMVSSKNMTKLSSGINVNLSQSPIGTASHSNILGGLQGSQSLVKKRTLAAYANPRARNGGRQNLIYTQK